MHFTINIEPKKVEQAQRALEAVGIEFNPHRNMVLLWDEANLEAVTTAASAGSITRTLNDLLRTEGTALRLQTLAEELTLEELEELLTFGHNPKEHFLESDGQTWLNRLAEDFPQLCRKLTNAG